LNPEPEANSTALTPTLRTAVVKLRVSLVLMQKAWQNHCRTSESGFWTFFTKRPDPVDSLF